MKTQKNVSIFLVEDDPTYANVLKYDLSSEASHKIRVFSSGEECVKKLHLKPDIILLDYYLNGKLNGIDVLQKIKHFGENIEVIFLSGQEKLEVAADAIRYGAYDYVVKNESAFIRVKGLIKKIQRYNKVLRENQELKMLKTFFLVGLAVFTLILIILNYFHPGWFDR